MLGQAFPARYHFSDLIKSCPMLDLKSFDLVQGRHQQLDLGVMDAHVMAWKKRAVSRCARSQVPATHVACLA